MAEEFQSRKLHEIGKCEENCCAGRLHVIFTPEEKRLLHAQIFRDCEFNRIDFSNADLRESRFLNVALTGCDFSSADLRGTSFIACDLHGANFTGVVLGRTRFDACWLIGALGLSSSMSDYVRENGGLLWLS
jgi:uncharacterized protein YjbI with pentapeptide repeats